MRLNDLSDNPKSRRAKKRVGRGIGSGTGKTATRGHKGQKSRSGVSLLGFEGGQMPLFRRLPKGGFTNIFKKRYRVINLDTLQRGIDASKLDPTKPITEDTLVRSGVIKSVRDGVRLLGNGKLSAAVNIHVTGVSKSAVESVESAGGSVVLSNKTAGGSDSVTDEQPVTGNDKELTDPGGQGTGKE